MQYYHDWCRLISSYYLYLKWCRRKLVEVQQMGILFESLDFLYVPAPDIEAAIGYYTGVLGSKLLWKIHAFGVWEACIQVSGSGPLLLLADHIKKNDMIMIYLVYIILSKQS